MLKILLTRTRQKWVLNGKKRRLLTENFLNPHKLAAERNNSVIPQMLSAQKIVIIQPETLYHTENIKS